MNPTSNQVGAAAEERKKRANGQGVPAALADLSRREQEAFERDFKRATAEGSPWRQMARGAGRGYTALGWRLYRDALYQRPRRRKGPDECRDPQCPCVAHKRNRNAGTTITGNLADPETWDRINAHLATSLEALANG